jgi:hypothetical protein
MTPRDKLRTVMNIWKKKLTVAEAAKRYGLKNTEINRLCRVAWDGASAFIEHDHFRHDLPKFLKR